ncbi:MAG: 50S ribosomal protein L21 [Candidatus Tyloplasma litorale]|nr:MAG: 50S ribosomal protein L21 [Mycoplasmatales bacterium]
MAEYAIIKTGGKQLKVQVGEPIWVEKLNNEVGEKVIFTEILSYSDGKKLSYGKPILKGKVEAIVEKQGKGPKVIIFRTKAKSNWSKKQGHRQPYTRLLIEKIIVEND